MYVSLCASQVSMKERKNEVRKKERNKAYTACVAYLITKKIPCGSQ